MEKKRELLLNAACILLAVGVCYVVAHYLAPVCMPFLIAFIFAYVIHKLSQNIGRYIKIPIKILNVGISVLFFGILAVIIVFLGGYIFSSLAQLIIDLPGLYQNEFLPWINGIIEGLDQRYQLMDQPFFETLEASFAQWSSEMGSFITDVSVSAMRIVSGYATGLPSAIIQIVITVVATFFMASDYEKIVGFIIGLLPEKGQKICRKITSKTKEVLVIYIKSYVLLMLLTFTELCIGLFILKIPYFPLIALGISIFDILPVLGTGGILIPWSVIALVIGNYRIAGGILVLYMIITVVRNVVEPRIVGRQIGLHPLATLIGLFVGLRLFGFVGMIGIPVTLSILVNLEKEGVIHWMPLNNYGDGTVQKRKEA